MNIVETLANTNNPVIAILAFAVMALSGVIVYQWKYTANKTVPKWVFDNMYAKVDQILDVQKTLTTIVDERLRK